MEAIRGMMLSVMAMAALSEMVNMIGSTDSGIQGTDMLCGLCCAGCMLNAFGSVIGVLM